MLKGGIIGVGIKGTGYIDLLNQDPRTEIVGIYDIDEKLMKEKAQKHNLKAFKSSKEMFKEGNLDFVYIGTPDFAHTEYILQAVEYNVNVLVEKPLATNLEEAEQIYKVVKNSDIKFMIAFSNRFNQPFIVAKRAIDKGELGEIMSINTKLNDSIYVPTKMLNWVDKSSPAWFLMSHTMDLASWYKNKKVVSVYATGVKKILVEKGIDTYDCLQAAVKYQDGTQGFFESQWILPEGVPILFDFKFNIVGSKGYIEMDTQDQMFHLIKDDYKYRGTMDIKVNERMLGQTAFTFQYFIDSLANNTEISPSIEEAFENVKLLSAVHQSAERNELIKLK